MVLSAVPCTTCFTTELYKVACIAGKMTWIVSQARINRLSRVIKRKEAPHHVMPVMLSLPWKGTNLAAVMNLATPCIQVLHQTAHHYYVQTPPTSSCFQVTDPATVQQACCTAACQHNTANHFVRQFLHIVPFKIKLSR